MLLMNVRSYTFLGAREAARSFKRLNPGGTVIVGGMHATVDIDSMTAVEEFDHIVQGGGENIVCDLVRDHKGADRVIKGVQSKSMADWPEIDRTLWPKEFLPPNFPPVTWPLEAACGWGPAPVATIMTSRVCPWKCSFCNEFAYIPNMDRRPVEMVIEELNRLDKDHGPLGSVVIHDSMFFQSPTYLEEWLEKYPKLANRTWPYWAAARSDTVRKWPDLFESLVKETNWNSVSIGFESGSDRVLKMLNKECTVEDNLFTIELLNRIGDDLEAQGLKRPRFWANIMYGIPGETEEDVLETERMVRKMNNPMITPATYAPFPGSMLGYQITAEGKSFMGDTHFRFQGGKYMKGIDYDFLRDVQNSAYDYEIESKEWLEGVKVAPMNGEHRKPSKFFLFPLKNGKRRLAYGVNVQEAMDILSTRMSTDEMEEIADMPPKEIRQQDIHHHVKELG